MLYVVYSIIPLIIGGIIYISFRSKNLVMFQWFDNIGISFFTNYIRYLFSPVKPYLSEWFYYSLPDGIWIFSFTTTLIIFWDFSFEKVKIWLVAPIFSGIFFEILQFFFEFLGTFDIIDLLFSMIGFILSFILLKNKPKNENYGSSVF